VYNHVVHSFRTLSTNTHIAFAKFQYYVEGEQFNGRSCEWSQEMSLSTHPVSVSFEDTTALKLHVAYPSYSVQNTAKDIAPKSMRAASRAGMQPIRGAVYPHVLNRQRPAARQLVLVVADARALVTSLLKITICHRSTLLCTLRCFLG
jgi:hypothetical protein